MRPAIAPAQPTQSRPLPLEYASRLPPRWPKLVELWPRARDLGPMFPWPSLATVGLLLACLGATFLMSLREGPWRLVRSRGSGSTTAIPMSATSAVAQVGWAILSLVAVAALLIRGGGAPTTAVTNDPKE